MNERNSRQSFLGAQFNTALTELIIGVVGLGGGGSHIVQQLAHMGFQHYVLCDPDVVEDSNLTRLVGANSLDAVNAVPKLDVASRLIGGLQPNARVICIDGRWQEHSEALRGCHVIFGCVDTFAGRSELEAFARRYLIAYIDIGMDVWSGPDGKPVLGGQVVLSLPGRPCMRCLGFLTEEQLGAEALAYGAAGGRPQVIWANGILASVAVARMVDLVANWSGNQDGPLAWSLDGNKLSVGAHWRSRNVEVVCPHYSFADVGPPSFKTL